MRVGACGSIVEGLTCADWIFPRREGLEGGFPRSAQIFRNHEDSQDTLEGSSWPSHVAHPLSQCAKSDSLGTRHFTCQADARALPSAAHFTDWALITPVRKRTRDHPEITGGLEYKLLSTELGINGRKWELHYAQIYGRPPALLAGRPSIRMP